MRRDECWNRHREPRMSCDLRASKSAVLDVDGRRRMAGSVANMKRDECEKPMSGTACVVQPECMDGGNLLQPEERNPSDNSSLDFSSCFCRPDLGGVQKLVHWAHAAMTTGCIIINVS